MTTVSSLDIEGARERLFRQLGHEIRDQRVLDAMAQVRRELFVPSASQHLAYEDMPLPIGSGQTISQPYIVALMTEALELTGKEKILEMGTGSGYQAAILARLAKQVITVERHPALAETAGRLLKELGYPNIEVHLARKAFGWPEGAPYQAIIVTAGAPKVPQALLDQLAEGGRMVIPVGSRWEQDLLKIIKHQDRVETVNLGGCRFVPLIGEEAWPEE